MDKYLESIHTHPDLSKIITKKCSENGICVTFDSSIGEDDYIILKVDDFYNSLGLEKTPPSPDCLILLKCVNGGYGLTIVELKSISNSKGFSLENLIGKFNTCINDFIENRFGKILNMDFTCVKLLFVSEIEVYRRDVGLKMDLLMNTRFRVGKKTCMITPFKPIPTIKKCY